MNAALAGAVASVPNPRAAWTWPRRALPVCQLAVTVQLAHLALTVGLLLALQVAPSVALAKAHLVATGALHLAFSVVAVVGLGGWMRVPRTTTGRGFAVTAFVFAAAGLVVSVSGALGRWGDLDRALFGVLIGPSPSAIWALLLNVVLLGTFVASLARAAEAVGAAPLHARAIALNTLFFTLLALVGVANAAARDLLDPAGDQLAGRVVIGMVLVLLVVTLVRLRRLVDGVRGAIDEALSLDHDFD